MFERMQLMLGKAFTVSLADLKREEGQGATEYAMVIGFVIVGLTITLGVLGTSIENFLDRVADKIDLLVP
jgi:Flp pilus assembly pilin Flp